MSKRTLQVLITPPSTKPRDLSHELVNMSFVRDVFECSEMKVTIENSQNKSILAKVWRVLKDPYYWALSLPSFFLLLLAGFGFLFTLACLMVLVWWIIRLLAHGIAPDLKEVHPKMLMGCACVAMMPLVSGLISRRMTRAEIRGRFVHFSKRVLYKSGNFVFTVIDMRFTQLIGTSIVVEIATGVDDLSCRRVNLGPPGIIALPTEISIPVGDIFPSLKQVASCDICGQSGFSSFKAYASHMSWFHGVARREATDEVLRSVEIELSKIRLFRVILTGTDEVSGKGGIAIKEYKRAEIFLTGMAVDDTFSVKTTEDYESSMGVHEDVSTTLSAKSHYIQVDLRP